MAHCLADRFPPGETVLLFEFRYLQPSPQCYFANTGSGGSAEQGRMDQEGSYSPLLVPAEFFSVSFHLPSLTLVGGTLSISRS